MQFMPQYSILAWKYPVVSYFSKLTNTKLSTEVNKIRFKPRADAIYSFNDELRVNYSFQIENLSFHGSHSNNILYETFCKLFTIACETN